jgi:conjugal transfer/type IV secretion protein DotA/TraY
MTIKAGKHTISSIPFKIKGGDVARYILLPALLPRLHNLFGVGFSQLAYLMAWLLISVGLLPRNHIYGRADSIGQFGIRHVIAQSWKNLKWDRHHIDQILMFGVIVLAFALIFGQIALILMGWVFETAHAAGLTGTGNAGLTSMFHTQYPKEDIALRMLDRVFGIPGIFGSLDAPASVSKIPPFQQGLQKLLGFYSYALLAVAVMIFLYYIVVVIAETAQSGTPFGQRFSGTWAPIRLVVAIGLLVPVAYGLNSAQFIVLYAAKWGSGFATNGWYYFGAHNHLLPGAESTAAQAGNNKNQGLKIVAPIKSIPPLASLGQFMAVAKTCQIAHQRAYSEEFTGNVKGRQIKPYVLRQNHWINGGGQKSNDKVNFLEIPAGAGGDFWKKALALNVGSENVRIVFGHLDPVRYSNARAGIYPHCGELVIHRRSKFRLEAVEVIETAYFQMIVNLWYNNPKLLQYAEYLNEKLLPYNRKNNNPSSPNISTSLISDMELTIIDQLKVAEKSLLDSWKKNGAYGAQYPQGSLQKYGWGGAGIWYNTVSEYNGALIGAVYNAPTVSRKPDVFVRKNNTQANSTTSQKNDEAGHNQGDDFQFDHEIKKVLQSAADEWTQLIQSMQSDREKNRESNTLLAVLNMMMGTSGLMDLIDMDDVHPLSHLSAAGRSMVETSVRNLGISVFAQGGSAFFSQWGASQPLLASAMPILGALGGAVSVFALMGLTAGVILGYVIPFMPFVFFFFAVGGWVKGIFEAMVGVPLWALAHLKLESNDSGGLPGSSGIMGYYLIFEVFLRPILIVFGLIASLSIFSASARIMHDLFPIIANEMLNASNNSGGAQASASAVGDIATALNKGKDFDTGKFVNQLQNTAYSARGKFDEFAITCMYAVLMYMLGNSSFKLIDMIPQNIMRWMGAGVETFNDLNQIEDPMNISTTYIAGGVGTHMTELSEIVHDSGGAVGTLLGRLTAPPEPPSLTSPKDKKQGDQQQGGDGNQAGSGGGGQGGGNQGGNQPQPQQSNPQPSASTPPAKKPSPTSGSPEETGGDPPPNNGGSPISSGSIKKAPPKDETP